MMYSERSHAVAAMASKSAHVTCMCLQKTFSRVHNKASVSSRRSGSSREELMMVFACRVPVTNGAMLSSHLPAHTGMWNRRVCHLQPKRKSLKVLRRVSSDERGGHECACATYMFSLRCLQGLGGVVVKLGTAESHPVFCPRSNLKKEIRLEGLVLMGLVGQL